MNVKFQTKDLGGRRSRVSRGSDSGGAPALTSEDAASGGIGIVTSVATKPWHPVQELKQQPNPSQVVVLDGAGRAGAARNSAVTVSAAGVSASAAGASWETDGTAVGWW